MEITEMLLELNPSDKRGVKICIQVVTQPAYVFKFNVFQASLFCFILPESPRKASELRERDDDGHISEIREGWY